VLATGMQPVAPPGWQPGSGVEQDEYGFLVATAEPDGLCPAGVASAPLDVSMSVQSATAAALKAVRTVRGSGPGEQGR